MARYKLDWDEWYPVYSIHEYDSNNYFEKTIDLDPEFVEHYNRVMDEFAELQDALNKKRFEE